MKKRKNSGTAKKNAVSRCSLHLVQDHGPLLRLFFCVPPRGCCSPPELAAGQEAGGKSAAWGRWCRIDLLDLKTRVASAAKGPRCDKLLPDELHGQLERTERRLLRLSLSSIYGRRVRLQRTVGARQVIHLAADNLS